VSVFLSTTLRPDLRAPFVVISRISSSLACVAGTEGATLFVDIRFSRSIEIVQVLRRRKARERRSKRLQIGRLRHHAACLSRRFATLDRQYYGLRRARLIKLYSQRGNCDDVRGTHTACRI
jgi:hypothetical protein